MRRGGRNRREIDTQKLSKHLMRIVIDPETGCWLIPGGEDVYHRVVPWPYAPKELLHRYIYETFVGRIPHGFVVDHLCGRCGCVNPFHLEPVTIQVNSRRAHLGKGNALKTHCLRGHPLSGENLYIIRCPDGTTARRCKACGNLATRRYRSAKRAMRSAKREKVRKCEGFEGLRESRDQKAEI